MEKVVTKKEYNKLLRRQKKIEAGMNALYRIVQHEMRDEVTDVYAKKLDAWSKELDGGKGKKFSTIKDIRQYFASL